MPEIIIRQWLLRRGGARVTSNHQNIYGGIVTSTSNIYHNLNYRLLFIAHNIKIPYWSVNVQYNQKVPNDKISPVVIQRRSRIFQIYHCSDVGVYCVLILIRDNLLAE